MGWERSVLALLEDLEQQAAGLQLVERDIEVDELARAAYGSVTMAARWHASDGARVQVWLAGGLEVLGEVRRTGRDWVLVWHERQEWVLPHSAVETVIGLSPRARADDALGVVRRLSLSSVLRRLAEEEQPLAVHLRSGRRVAGVLVRVGADFVEVYEEQRQASAQVNRSSVVALQTRREPENQGPAARG